MKNENQTTEVAVMEAARNEIMDDTGRNFLLEGSGNLSYSSLAPSTFEEKKKFFNMINSPEFLLQDKINLTIEVQHIYAETCQYVSKDNGDLIPGVRIVLLDKDGHSYSTSSKGVFNSLTKIFKIFGEPHQWGNPIPIRVKQISVANDRKVLTLEAV